LSRSGPPIFTGGTLFDQADGEGMTVFGVIATAATRHLHLAFSDGSQTTVSLQRVSSSRSGAEPLGNLRYGVLVLRGARCLERMVSRSAAGKTLWQGLPAGPSCGH
jgi:hypothetical protein